MAAFKTLILVINIFSSISVVCLVLMQQGKGADAGAGFGGSGSAQGVFGSAGNANFLSRMTALFATIFFVSSLALSYVHSGNRNKGIDFSNVQQTASVAASAPAGSVSVASQPALPQQTAPAAASASATSTSQTVPENATVAPVAASAENASEPAKQASEPAAKKENSKKAEPAKTKNNTGKNKHAKPAGKQNKK